MKYIIILTLLWTFASFSMEKEEPQPFISYTQECKETEKFKKYHLDNPEKFLQLFLKQLKKERNTLPYVKDLQELASILFWQHTLMQTAADLHYIRQFILSAQQEYAKWKKEIGAIQSAQSKQDLYIYPKTSEQLNLLIKHANMLKKGGKFNPEEIQLIELWSQDENLGIWFNKFSLILLLGHQLETPIQLEEKYLKVFVRETAALMQAFGSDTLQKNKALKEYTTYFEQLLNNCSEFAYKLNILQEKKKNSKFEQFEIKNYKSMFDEYLKKEASISKNYSICHHFYEQLYKIIKNELHQNITTLLKSTQGVGKPMNFLNLLPIKLIREEGKLNNYPSILPKELAAFQDPQISITLKLTALDIWNSLLEKEENKKLKETQEHKERAIQKRKEKEERRKKLPIKIKESVTDKSFMLKDEETENNVTIHDEKNKTKIILYKSDTSFVIPKDSLPPINYTEWVKEWFKNPDQALTTQGYRNKENKKFTPEHRYWFPIAIHSFALLVDEFIEQWGTQTTIPSRRKPNRKDILVTIPGMMIFPDGTKETGVFSYLIDSDNGQWYHRMFEPQTGTKLIDDLFEKGYFSPEMKGYYDVFFPPLKKEH